MSPGLADRISTGAGVTARRRRGGGHTEGAKDVGDRYLTACGSAALADVPGLLGPGHTYHPPYGTPTTSFAEQAEDEQ